MLESPCCEQKSLMLLLNLRKHHKHSFFSTRPFKSEFNCSLLNHSFVQLLLQRPNKMKRFFTLRLNFQPQIQS